MTPSMIGGSARGAASVEEAVATVAIVAVVVPGSVVAGARVVGEIAVVGAVEPATADWISEEGTAGFEPPHAARRKASTRSGALVSMTSLERHLQP
jgi:hypothetical protein